MVAIDEFYKFLQSQAQDVVMEGEFINSTVFAVHITEKKVHQFMEQVKSAWGARIFDYTPPYEWPDDQPDTRASNDPSRLAAFRCYVPPTADSEIFLSSAELMDKIVAALNKALCGDQNAIRRMMSQNFACEVTFAENQKYIRCNAVLDPSTGRGTPTITPWAFLNGIVEEVTGQRLNLKTEDDARIEPGKIIPIEAFMKAKS